MPLCGEALIILKVVLFWEFYCKAIFKFIKMILVILPSYTHIHNI